MKLVITILLQLGLDEGYFSGVVESVELVLLPVVECDARLIGLEGDGCGLESLGLLFTYLVLTILHINY